MRRRSTYVVPLLLVAVVGGAAGTVLALTTDSGSGPDATAIDSGAPAGSEGSGASDASPSGSTGAPATEGVRLPFVFHSMRNQDCAQDPTPDPADGLLERWTCHDSLGAAPATVYYARWATVTDAAVDSDGWTDGSYARRPDATDRAGVGFDRWSGTNDGAYKMTWAYRDAPFSVTVVLPADVRPPFDDVLLDGLVELRPPEDLP